MPGPKYDPTMIVEHVLNRSRVPFADVLGRLLLNVPTDKAIQNEAERFPNRWVQNVIMLQRAAGYTDKQEIEVSFLQKIQQLSDSQLEDEIKRFEQEHAAISSATMSNSTQTDTTRSKQTNTVQAKPRRTSARRNGAR